MQKNTVEYDCLLATLKQELVPALGCTEPIAIAYAAAVATQALGGEPEHLTVRCSGNIIKNAKAVVVPRTGSLKGIEVSAILGAVGGNPERKLEVLEGVTESDVARTQALLAQKICDVALIEGTSNLHIILEVLRGGDHALVEIQDEHTNIVRVEKNGELLFCGGKRNDTNEPGAAATTIEHIWDFANTVDIEDVRGILDTQIKYNTRIAEEGLHNSYGANVGATLLESCGYDVRTLAKAYPAAGSDARMSGCMLPVVINSGSGNQGMTVSLPVIVYARHLGVGKETLYRALVLSNLLAIHQKAGIGRLSAYCGVVSAATGSGAAIAYLQGADFETVSATVINTLANVSGIVCDGAKASCAAKIASAVDAALLGCSMAEKGRGFRSGEGIVKDDAQRTIDSVSRLGRDGMRETDVEILRIMIGD